MARRLLPAKHTCTPMREYPGAAEYTITGPTAPREVEEITLRPEHWRKLDNIISLYIVLRDYDKRMFTWGFFWLSKTLPDGQDSTAFNFRVTRDQCFKTPHHSLVPKRPLVPLTLSPPPPPSSLEPEDPAAVIFKPRHKRVRATDFCTAPLQADFTRRCSHCEHPRYQPPENPSGRTWHRPSCWKECACFGFTFKFVAIKPKRT